MQCAAPNRALCIRPRRLGCFQQLKPRTPQRQALAVSPKRAQARKPLAKPNHGKDGYLSANDGDRVGDSIPGPEEAAGAQPSPPEGGSIPEAEEAAGAQPVPPEGGSIPEAEEAAGVQPVPPEGGSIPEAEEAAGAQQVPPEGGSIPEAEEAAGAQPVPPEGGSIPEAEEAAGVQPVPPEGGSIPEAEEAAGAQQVPPEGGSIPEAEEAAGVQPVPPEGGSIPEAEEAAGAQPAVPARDRLDKILDTLEKLDKTLKEVQDTTNQNHKTTSETLDRLETDMTDSKKFQASTSKALASTSKTLASTSKTLGSMAEKLELQSRVMRKADKELRSPMLITTGTQLLNMAVVQLLGLRPSHAGLVKAVLEGHRGLHAKEQLLIAQLKAEAKSCKVDLPPFHAADDWLRRADALQEVIKPLRAYGGKNKKWSWDRVQGQLTAYYQAAAKGEDALRSFLEHPRQDGLLLTLVAAMAARRNADAVEFNAAPLISWTNGKAVVRLLEIKAHATELKKAKKQLLEQAAVLALVLRRAVLPEALDLQPQFCGQASSALDRPSDAQLRSLHGSELPLAYKGGPWELEPLHLRLSLLDE